MKKTPSNIFGLHINNTAITAVELLLDKKENQPKVINYGRVELEPGTIEDDSIILNPEAFKKSVLELLKKGKHGEFLSKNVNISIPEEKTFFHPLTIPGENANSKEAIIRAAKDFIPINLSEAIVDYRIVNTDEDGYSLVNFTAVQKSVIAPTVDILEEIGLNVVSVEPNKNSIVRSCNNAFQKNDDFMIINVGEYKTLFEIKTKSGNSYGIGSHTAGIKMSETVKEKLKIVSDVTVKKLLLHPDKPSSKKYKDTEAALKPHIEHFQDKTKKLLSIIKNNGDDIKIKTLYFIGLYSSTPGLKEAFLNMLSDIKAVDQFSYIDLGTDTEQLYVEAIGLALRKIVSDEEVLINLLPGEKKKELDHAKLMPIVRQWLIGLAVIITGLAVFGGIVVQKKYFNFKMSEHNLMLHKDKANNPYLKQAVQTAQQKTQMDSQVNNILKEAVPPSQIMRTIDSFNSNQVRLSSAHYQINNKKEVMVQLGARSQSRQATENLIVQLEEEEYFTDVISPLSNLVGKGERFISINLKVNPILIISDFNEIHSEEKKEEEVADEDEVGVEEGDVDVVDKEEDEN